jgi:hypothetical protein
MVVVLCRDLSLDRGSRYFPRSINLPVTNAKDKKLRNASGAIPVRRIALREGKTGELNILHYYYKNKIDKRVFVILLQRLQPFAFFSAP